MDNTLDVLVDAIASSIPGLNIAWGLTKAYCGAGLRLRQERAIQYIELIRDNPDIFTEQLFQNELFQDAFVYGMENYIRLSLESKRDIAKKILI